MSGFRLRLSERGRSEFGWLNSLSRSLPKARAAGLWSPAARGEFYLVGVVA